MASSLLRAAAVAAMALLSGCPAEVHGPDDELSLELPWAQEERIREALDRACKRYCSVESCHVDQGWNAGDFIEVCTRACVENGEGEECFAVKLKTCLAESGCQDPGASECDIPYYTSCSDLLQEPL